MKMKNKINKIKVIKIRRKGGKYNVMGRQI